MTANSYLRQRWQRLRQWGCDNRVRGGAWVGLRVGIGFVFSAASLDHSPQIFAMALVSSLTGWRCCLTALGAAAGYLYFWRDRGFQGVVWTVFACLAGFTPSKVRRRMPWLVPALCALIVSVSGLGFQIFGRIRTETGMYLLRVALAAPVSRLYTLVRQRKGPVTDWLAEGTGVLALAQVAPVPWLGLGYIAAGALALAEAFPAAAVAGLALDLARISRVPMTAVLCGIWLTRLVPGIPEKLRKFVPGAVYLLVMSLCGVRDYYPVIPFFLGGLLSGVHPGRGAMVRRRGETGMAQVRLELMAGVLGQTRQLLMEVTEPPIDCSALLIRAGDRACGSCPNRKGCRRPETLPENLLSEPLGEPLPFACKKPARMLRELTAAREQYRSIRADRERQREYRRAVVQQYGFLENYLRTQADRLPRRGERVVPRYRPWAGVASSGKEYANGDRYQQFYGPGCRFYMLLCDGMGTGTGAAEEGKTAADLLRRMLCAGFPAEHTLESLNSLLALRGRAGAVTVDLAEIHLDSGRAVLYKWGAVPSLLVSGKRAKKIGTAGPPPGIGLKWSGETVERLSLCRGEMLILLSDGVDGEEVRRCRISPGEPPGETAAKLLARGAADKTDDATVAVVRLYPEGLST